MVVSVDAFEAGREIKKLLQKPGRPTPFDPEMLITLERKDGRINFVTQDKDENVVIGCGCNSEPKEDKGIPYFRCERNNISKKEKMNLKEAIELLNEGRTD